MASEIDSKNQKITYGSIISISHLSDEDALIAGDGLTKRSVVLKGMSPYHRQQTKRFTIDQFNNFGIANCLFIICPKMSNGAKTEVLKKLSCEEEEIQPPQTQQNKEPDEVTSLKSISKKEVGSKNRHYIFSSKIVQLLHLKISKSESSRSESSMNISITSRVSKKKRPKMCTIISLIIRSTYDQQVQFLHVASSKWLACHSKEAKFENQNFKLSLVSYSSEATLFRIVPAFKYQKDGDQNIYAGEIVRIVRSVPILNKPTFLHCSGEKIDVKKSQFFVGSQAQKTGELKIQKREVNASLEDVTSWKINLFSEYIPEGTKQLKAGDILWLHHSEKNATLAAHPSVKAFDKTKFQNVELTKWMSLENIQVSVGSIQETQFESYIGNTSSMWIVESTDYKTGGMIQYEKHYRLKHFSSSLYLSVQRPPPEVKEPPPVKKDPYAIRTEQQVVQVKPEYVSRKDPPAKLVLTTVPEKSTLFEFKPLKESDLEKRFVESGTFVYLKNIEHKKYIDIISKLDEEGGAELKNGPQSQYLTSYLKPVLRNEKEKSDYAVFKLYRPNASETLEFLFLDSCYKSLLKFLYYISNFHWKNDNSDKELLKIMEKKLTTCQSTLIDLDDFLNNKIYNSTPEQKFGITNKFRQSIARQQQFIDIVVKILAISVTKEDLEMWENRKQILIEIEQEEKNKKNDNTQLQQSKRRQKEGLTRKNKIEFNIKKVDICNILYKVLISICKNNAENQLYIEELLPYFLMHAKYIPMCVTFIVSLFQSNLSLLLKLSENLKIDFDYSTQTEVKEDMDKKIKVLINLYERETNQQIQPDNNKLIIIKTHEKITQKPLNLINFFFNILWDQNSLNKEDYIIFLSSICTYNNYSVQINQENLFKLYKKHNSIQKLMGVTSDEYFEDNDWDGMIRFPQDQKENRSFLIPNACDKKKFKFLSNQLLFFSQVSFGRNYLWKRELAPQFPQKFLFKNIWNLFDNPKLNELRPLNCKLTQSLYVDHQPLRKIILPNYCRLFKQCDQPKQIDLFQLWASKNQDFFENEIRNLEDFKEIYKIFINDMTTYLEQQKDFILSHINAQYNKKKAGIDYLNDELIFNTAELIMLLLQLDIFEIVFGSEANYQYMRIIEPLIVFMQYDRKNLKYLNASIKSIEDEVKKRKEKKDEKRNPIGAIKLPGALSFQSMVNLVKKEEPPVAIEEEENDDFNGNQNLDDASLFLNPIMRGFIQLNHKLEALTYQEYAKIKTEIELKLKICSIFDHFLDKRQNFFISNILVFFKHRINQQQQNAEKKEKENDPINEQEDENEQKMVTLVNDYLIGLIPNIARTGIKVIDEPEKEAEDPFAFMNLKKLANLKNMFDEKKPERFTNYFEQYKLEGFLEQFDLDQYLSLKANDEDVKEDPIATALPYLLNTFFFVHDELLEERCLNVTMRIFNQREELRNNLKNLQILFSDEKTQLFLYLEKTMVHFTELIERSEIWLSEFNKKTISDFPEMQNCCDILNNLAMGFFHNISIHNDKIDLIKEAENKLVIDDQKQSVMNFLQVHLPVIELIKNGFHLLTEVLLDSMFPEHKKKIIIDLFSGAYQFLIRFCQHNKQNQLILFQDLDIFLQYLQYNVGQIELIQEIFRDNHKLLTTKVDTIFLNRILAMIHHEGRQKSFIDLYRFFKTIFQVDCFAQSAHTLHI